MDPVISLKYVLNSVIFALLGLGGLTLAFVIFDKFTPYHLWKELTEKQNIALAIVVGSVTLGIALIIASAIHG